MAGKEFNLELVLGAALNARFINAFGKAQKQISGFDKSISELNKRAAQLKSNFGSGLLSSGEFMKSMSAVYKAQAGAHFERASGLFTQSISDMSALYVKAQGLAKMFSGPVQSAMQFESAMADVKKVVNFESPKQLQEMSDTMLELSTRIPMAADQLAAIAASGGQAGLAREELAAFAESAAKMGVAFNTTAENAGDMMATWRTAFKMNQDQVNELANKVNLLGNTSAASAVQISEVITRIGPLGEVGGIASGEIAALGSALVASGINADVAATGIKSMILTMSSGKANAGFKKLGIDAKQLSANMQVDARGTILDLLEKLRALKPDEQVGVLRDMFGKSAISSVAPLLSNIETLRENFDKVADSEKYANSVNNEFAARAATTDNSVQLLKNSLQATSITIGNALLPSVNTIVSGMADLAGRFQRFAAANPTLITGLLKTTAVAGGLFVAMHAGVIIGKDIMGVWHLAQGVMKLLQSQFIGARAATIAHTVATKAAAVATTAWTNAQAIFSVAMTRLGPILAGAGRSMMGLFSTLMTNPWTAVALAAVAAAVLIYKNWDKICAWFQNFWGKIGPGLSKAWNGIKKGFANLWPAIIAGPIGAIAVIYKNWDKVTAWFGGFWNRIKPGLSKAWDSIKNGFGLVALGPIGAGIAIYKNWDKISAYFKGFWNRISPSLNEAWDGIKAGFSQAWNAVVDIFGGFWGRISASLTEAWNGMKAGLSSVGNWFAEKWTAVSQVFEGFWNKISPNLDEAWNGIQAGFASVGAWFSQAWDSVVGVFSGFWGRIASNLTEAWNGIRAGLSSVGDWFAEKWPAVSQVFEGFWTSISPSFSEAWNGIRSGLTAVSGWLGERWNDVSQIFSGFWASISPSLMEAWNGIQNGFAAMGNWFTQKWDSIVGIFSGFWEKISPNFSAVWDGIKNGLSSVTDWVSQKWEAFTSIFSFGSKTPATMPTPNAPLSTDNPMAMAVQGNAKGGYFNKPTLSMVGEGDSPEYVIPVRGRNRNNGVGLWQQAGRDLGVLGNSSARSSAPQITNNFSITVNAGSGQTEDITSALESAIQTAMARLESRQRRLSFSM